MIRRVKGLVWGWLGITLIVGIILFQSYGTVVPCGVLKAEIERQAAIGQLNSLTSVPGLMMNDGNQAWCAKEYVKLLF